MCNVQSKKDIGKEAKILMNWISVLLWARQAMRNTPVRRPPQICTWSVIWLIYARDFVILIFSTREFMIEDSILQLDLLKI